MKTLPATTFATVLQWVYVALALTIALVLWGVPSSAAAHVVEGHLPTPAIIVKTRNLEAPDTSHTPVVIMHGLFESSAAMEPLMEHINKTYPGAPMVSLNIMNYISTLEPMWIQVTAAIEVMKQLPPLFDKGYHCIAFSQGTLVMRGVIHKWPEHKCKHFITLSGPLMGQFGDTSYLRYLFPEYTRDSLYRVFYTQTAQNWISIANYWRDPYEFDYYKNASAFLALINNERRTNESELYKKNFLKVNKIVAIGGPDDGVIQPWQSAVWGFYHCPTIYPAPLLVTPMDEQEVYQKDLFGLRTIVERGSFKMCIVNNVEHSMWYSDEAVYLKCVAPFLD
ncbi:holo-[acyl-carrier-protein] synthase [Balamuthia mandrillaris]